MDVLMPYVRALWRLALAFVCGCCWWLSPRAFAFSPFVLVAWGHARSPAHAWSIMTLYCTAATHEAAGPLERMVELRPGSGALIMLMLVSILGAAWALAWGAPIRASMHSSLWRTTIALLLTGLPGLGCLGVASPLTAGLWLPGHPIYLLGRGFACSCTGIGQLPARLRRSCRLSRSTGLAVSVGSCDAVSV
jgi:hypothetical protein